jgi:hypothetical protein
MWYILIRIDIRNSIHVMLINGSKVIKSNELKVIKWVVNNYF